MPDCQMHDERERKLQKLNMSLSLLASRNSLIPRLQERKLTEDLRQIYVTS